MKIFIIIPIFNKENFTISCLNDLSYLDNRHNIIIVDNGSTKYSSDIVESLINKLNVNETKFHYYRLDTNIGFGKGNGFGYEKAKELGGTNDDIYIFLNNDIKVKTNKIDWTDIVVNEVTDTNIVGPTGGLVDENYNFVYETEDSSKKMNYISGWCVGMLGSVAEKLADQFPDNEYRGIFPQYNLAYFEDTHMSIIAKKIGLEFKLIKLPLVHFKRTTAKTMNLQELYIKARQEFLKRIK